MLVLGVCGSIATISGVMIVIYYDSSIFYRNYKTFDVSVYRNTSLNELALICHGKTYDNIRDILVSKLDILAPIKRKRHPIYE